MAKRPNVERLNKKLGVTGELTVAILIAQLEKLPADMPVFCGNQQAAIGLEVREGRIGQDYYGSTFSPVPGGKYKGLFLTCWSEDSTGEVGPTIYSGPY